MAQGKLAKRTFHQAVTNREGEGVVVGLVRQRSSTGYGIALDFTSAPVPERRFSADTAWIAFAPDMVRILFGQFKGAGPDLEHVVVVRMSFLAARFFLDSMKGVSRTGHDYLSKINDSQPLADPPRNLPAQTFTLDANIIIAGFSGREACMDLYYSSPHVKVALQRGANEYRADPVARVMLTTRLMMNIHDELASKRSTFPSDESDAYEVEAQDE